MPFITSATLLLHKKFRKDLASRLDETRTFFVYPAFFDEIVQREFKGFLYSVGPDTNGIHQQVEVNYVHTVPTA